MLGWGAQRRGLTQPPVQECFLEEGTSELKSEERVGTSPRKKWQQECSRQSSRLCKGLLCLEENCIYPVPSVSTTPMSPFLVSLSFTPPFNHCQ